MDKVLTRRIVVVVVVLIICYLLYRSKEGFQTKEERAHDIYTYTLKMDTFPDFKPYKQAIGGDAVEWTDMKNLHKSGGMDKKTIEETLI